jgi:SagB-type dehydrogenase family enzyme
MTTATGYWHDAIYDPAGTLLDGLEHRAIKEGDPREPLKFKAYRGLPRLALPPPELTLRTPCQPATIGRRFDTGAVSTLLYHAYGVNRHDPEPGSWPYHRTVPSARCFHPTELYLVLPTGVHYYDPMHHALVLLRDGDHRPLVAAAVGAGLADAAAVVLLSSLFWKTAFRYRDYAYRLCTQEAGMVAGNVLLAASALGHDTHVHLLFRDDPLNRLLGLAEPEENVLSVLALHQQRRNGARPAPPRPDPTPHGATGAPTRLDVVHLRPSAYDPAVVPVLTRISRASLLTGAGRVGHATLTGPDDSGPGPTALAAPGRDAEESLDLAAALRDRDSGGRHLDFRPAEAPAEAVWRIARAVARPYPTDVVAPDARPPCRCYLVVHRVSDIAPGIYRVAPDGSALDPVRVGPVTDDLCVISGHPALPNVNVAHASLVALLVAPWRAATDRFGPRSFRILNQVAGIAAQRICVLSAASGLTARVHNGYAARAAEAALGLPGSGATVVFQILVGPGRPDPTLRLPVVF